MVNQNLKIEKFLFFLMRGGAPQITTGSILRPKFIQNGKGMEKRHSGILFEQFQWFYQV